MLCSDRAQGSKPPQTERGYKEETWKRLGHENTGFMVSDLRELSYV